MCERFQEELGRVVVGKFRRCVWLDGESIVALCGHGKRGDEDGSAVVLPEDFSCRRDESAIAQGIGDSVRKGQQEIEPFLVLPDALSAIVTPHLGQFGLELFP